MNLSELYQCILLGVIWLQEALMEWSKTSTFTYPVFLSLVAALIFWIAFAHIPERVRKRKLRPIVELCIFESYKSLFSLFDLIMGHQKNSPSYYQSEIRSGKLSDEQIRLGLQNKCLNSSYLICDNSIKDKLIIVGQKILDQTLLIEYFIDKAITYSQFATAEELILLEKILHELRRYDYGERRVNHPAQSISGKNIFYPTVPVIYYRSQSFSDLYKLFCELQFIVMGRLPSLNKDRDHVLWKIQYQYYSSAYTICKRFIESQKNMSESDVFFLKTYIALCENSLGNCTQFYLLVDKMFKDRPFGVSLIGSRHFLKYFIEDKKVIDILSKYFSNEEIAQLRVAVKEDSDKKEWFEASNRKLSEYFSLKDKRLVPVGEVRRQVSN